MVRTEHLRNSEKVSEPPFITKKTNTLELKDRSEFGYIGELRNEFIKNEMFSISKSTKKICLSIVEEHDNLNNNHKIFGQNRSI